MKDNNQFVLLSEKGSYFVEYLLGHLILSDSISEAAVFSSIQRAQKFKKYLGSQCQINFSVNTFIPLEVGVEN